MGNEVDPDDEFLEAFTDKITLLVIRLGTQIFNGVKLDY